MPQGQSTEASTDLAHALGGGEAGSDLTGKNPIAQSWAVLPAGGELSMTLIKVVSSQWSAYSAPLQQLSLIKKLSFIFVAPEPATLGISGLGRATKTL